MPTCSGGGARTELLAAGTMTVISRNSPSDTQWLVAARKPWGVHSVEGNIVIFKNCFVTQDLKLAEKILLVSEPCT